MYGTQKPLPILPVCSGNELVLRIRIAAAYYASPLLQKPIGMAFSSAAVGLRAINPLVDSYLAILSCKESSNRLACSGVRMIRLRILGLASPGSMVAKSTINSEVECEMMAKFE